VTQRCHETATRLDPFSSNLYSPFLIHVEVFRDLAGNSRFTAPGMRCGRERRLIKAGSILLNSAPERLAVKRAALDVGFTELGRFSMAYRRIFGESPSATLIRSSDWSATNGPKARVHIGLPELLGSNLNPTTSRCATSRSLSINV